jgi:hypothetical protein
VPLAVSRTTQGVVVVPGCGPLDPFPIFRLTFFCLEFTFPVALPAHR